MEAPSESIVSAELLALIKEFFRPATSYQEATAKYTTAEFFAIIDRHAPGSFYPGQMQPALKQLGYSTVTIGEEIRWLVRAL